MLSPEQVKEIKKDGGWPSEFTNEIITLIESEESEDSESEDSESEDYEQDDTQ